MKKILSFAITCIILISSVNVVVFGCDTSSNITDEENIHYVITINSENISRSSGTRTGTKTITAYNDDDEKIWDATIRATFSYTGSSATCTSASISYNTYGSLWEITSATANRSSNKAVGNIVAKKYVLGICVKTVEESFTLTCSANGTLS